MRASGALVRSLREGRVHAMEVFADQHEAIAALALAKDLAAELSGEQGVTVRPVGSQTVLLFLDLLNAGDLDTALAHVSEGAELDWSDSEAINRGTYRGRAAWRSWFSEHKHDFGELRFETTEVLEPRPGTVVTVMSLRGRGRASGLEVAALGAGVWTLDGAAITSATMYQTREEALAAAEAQK